MDEHVDHHGSDARVVEGTGGDVHTYASGAGSDAGRRGSFADSIGTGSDVSSPKFSRETDSGTAHHLKVFKQAALQESTRGREESALAVKEQTEGLVEGLNAIDELDAILPIDSAKDPAQSRWREARRELTRLRELMMKDSTRDCDVRAWVSRAMAKWMEIRVKMQPFLTDTRVIFDPSAVQSELEILKHIVSELTALGHACSSAEASFDWNVLMDYLPSEHFGQRGFEQDRETAEKPSAQMQEALHQLDIYEKAKQDLSTKLKALAAHTWKTKIELSRNKAVLESLNEKVRMCQEDMKRAIASQEEAEQDLQKAKSMNKKSLEDHRKKLEQQSALKVAALDKLRCDHRAKLAAREAQSQGYLMQRRQQLLMETIGFNADRREPHWLFMVDGSGSMSGAGWNTMRRSLGALLDKRRSMGGNEEISVGWFSHKNCIVKQSGSLRGGWFTRETGPDVLPAGCPGGGTSFASALGGLRTMWKSVGSKQRPIMVLMTDGQAGETDVQVACSLAEELYNESHGSLIFLGVGWGTGLTHLHRVVRSGNGGASERTLEAGTIQLCVESSQVLDLGQNFSVCSDKFELLESDFKKKVQWIDDQMKELEKLDSKEADRLKANFKLTEEQMDEDGARFRSSLDEAKLDHKHVVKVQKDVVEDEIKRVGMQRDQLEDLHKEKNSTEQLCEQLRQEVLVAEKAEIELDDSQVKATRQIADAAMTAAYHVESEKQMMNNAVREKLRESLGFDDAGRVHHLSRCLRAVMKHAILVTKNLSMKHTHLGDCIWYLKDTISKFESNEVNPGKWSMEDRVKLVEHELDERLLLNLVDGEELGNFDRIIDHAFPECRRDMDRPEDCAKVALYDAVLAVRRSTLKVADFMESEEDPKTSIWTSKVARQCAMLEHEHFSAVKAAKQRVTELQDVVGEDRDEMARKKEAWLSLMEKDQEKRQQQIDDLKSQLERASSDETKDTALKEDLKKRITDMKSEKSQEKENRKQEWREQREELDALQIALDAGVDGNPEKTLTKWKFYKEDLESKAKLVITQLQRMVTSPYDSFVQHYCRWSFQHRLALGHAMFYKRAAKYEYLSRDFDKVFALNCQQRLEYLQSPRPPLMIDDSKLAISS